METNQKVRNETAQIIYETWIKSIFPSRRPQFVYIHDDFNAALMADFIDTNCDGIFTYDNLSAALANSHVWNRLHVRTKELTAAEKAAKAEAERVEKIIAHNTTVATEYLKNRAPSGLLVNGDFYQASADKVIAFLTRNYKDQPLTDAMLTEAIETLGFTNGAAGGSLDWFDKSPNAVVFRNTPPPPPRKLSEKAQREAGMIPERLRGHENDGKLVNPAEALKKIAQMTTGGMQNPWRTKCEGLTVLTRNGRTDHGFVAKLNQTFAKYGDGSVNWQETFRLRDAACTQYERTRNRD